MKGAEESMGQTPILVVGGGLGKSEENWEKSSKNGGNMGI
jgi:hypothetical protein